MCPRGWRCLSRSSKTCLLEHPLSICPHGSRCTNAGKNFFFFQKIGFLVLIQKIVACGYSHATLCSDPISCSNPDCEFAHEDFIVEDDEPEIEEEY